MNKLKLGIIFGGSSNEHEVSISSATSVIAALDKTKYHITPIYLDKDNIFYTWEEDIANIKTVSVGFLPQKLAKIENICTFLKGFDCIFIMMHGEGGEDGKIASLLELLNIPYVGNKPQASILTMNKVLTKDILEANNIKTSPYLAFYKYNEEFIFKGNSYKYVEILDIIEREFSYPVYVKPANSGSSIGVRKSLNYVQLDEAIKAALQIDNQILIEKAIKGRELECAMLEEDGVVKASCIGEVVVQDQFYSFAAKYQSRDSQTIIPAEINKEQARKIKEIAIAAFKILQLHGYSRIDFFLTEDMEIILNEINTIPGFTSISMYPKLWEESGISYTKLLDILIVEKTRK